MKIRSLNNVSADSARARHAESRSLTPKSPQTSHLGSFVRVILHIPGRWFLSVVVRVARWEELIDRISDIQIP
jgi:hypothetical protein